MSSLKDTISSSSKLDPAASHNAKKTKQQQHPSCPPTILLLDGGISTHLESSLLLGPVQQQKIKKEAVASHRPSSVQQPLLDNSSSSPFPDRNLWSSSLLLTPSGRDLIQQAHLDFAHAGSDILTTVTYQLSPLLMTRNIGSYADATQIQNMFSDAVSLADKARQEYGSDWKEKNLDESESINQTWSSRQGRRKRGMTDRAPAIVVSLGCYGAALANGSEYTGHYDGTGMDELMEFHRVRLEWIGQIVKDGRGVVDGVAFETVPSMMEVRAIVTVLLEYRRRSEKEQVGFFLQHDWFVWLSLACKDAHHLNDGTCVEEVMDYVKEMDADGSLIHGIGVNCCKVKYVYDLSEKIARHIIRTCSLEYCKRILLLYPNSGEEWDDENKAWVEGTGCTNSQDFASEMMRCIRNIHDICAKEQMDPPLGIFVGGCCRTTPMTIRAIGKAVDEYLCAYS